MHRLWGRSLLLVCLVTSSLLSARPTQSQQSIIVEPTQQEPTQLKNVPTLQPGDAGPSLYLNGSSYLAVPAASAPALGQDWTVEAWVYPSSTTGCRAVLGKDYANGLWFGLCNGAVRFHRGSAAFIQGTTIVPVNQWTHIAVSTFYEPYSGEYLAEILINGESEGYYSTSGNGSVGGTRELRIGNDQAWDYFLGDIAEVRLWSYARGEIATRRDMHTTLDQKPGGLVAAWHLAGDYVDSISGATATPVGTAQFVGYVSPVTPPTTPVDEFFNTLPQSVYGAASAYVPRLNRALLLGGYRSGVPSNAVTAIDAASGSATALGSLPAALGLPSAAYAATNDTIYLFGGSSDTADTSVNTIYAVNPETGAVRSVAATLPQSLYIASAVYHARLKKIVLFGGYRLPEGALSNVYVFDVASETISTAAFSLPQAAYGQPGVYSTATGKIYLFGGTDGVNTLASVLEVTLNAAGSDGTVTTLASQLPIADARTFAVEDPLAKMIYVAGGSFTTRVLAFDPQTGELWRTPLEMPKASVNTAEPYYPAPASKIKPYATAIYSARNRHALVFGGGGFGGTGSNTIWRVPLGDGPLVELGQWDFKSFATGSITALDGDERALLVGTNVGAWLFYTYGNDALPSERFYSLGGAASAVRWDKYGVRPYFGANNKVYFGWPSGAITQIYDPQWNVLDIEPTGPNTPPMFGANTINRGFVNQPSFYAPNGSLSAYTYGAYGPNCSATTSIKVGPGPLFLSTYYWGINQVRPACAGTLRPGDATTDVVTSTAPLAGPLAPTADAPSHIYRLRQSPATGAWSSVDLGTVCNNAAFVAQKMTFGRNNDLWVTGDSGVCRYAGSNLPGGTTPIFNVYDLPYANAANNVSVDGDGRIWFSTDGGLSVFEVRRDGNVPISTLRASDFNYLNAPIGSTSGSSALNALVAVGEKVFTARGNLIYTLAQRWNQLDPGGTVNKLWTIRGRLFAATTTMLRVLQPDGATWQSSAASVQDVLQDRTGRIWVAHNNGVQWWASNGALQDIPGLALNEPVLALAEDQNGRIWLGLNDGLALYDRNRLVTRIATPAGAVTTTKLLVDRDNNLWVGTSNGLARFDPADATWAYFTVGSGLPFLAANAITDITERNDGTLFISTAKGVVRRAPGEAGFSLVVGSINPAPLDTDELGRVWAGNSVEVQNNSWRWYYWTNSGIRSSQVSDVAADHTDRVWLANATGGISVRGSFLPPLADEVPTISAISPTSATAGQTVTILGSGFGTDKEGLTVEIGGATARVDNAFGTSITVQVGPDTVSGSVSVRRGKRKTTFNNGAGTAFCAVPTINSVTPTGTNIGGLVEISGTNFDPRATLQIGAGTPRGGVTSPRKATLTVEASDTSGALVLSNVCAGATATRADFRRFNLSISRTQLNQGYVGMPLSAGNATIASAWVSVDQALRSTDQLQLDYFSLQLGPAGSSGRQSYGMPINGAIPRSVGPPAEGVYRDLASAVNLANVIYFGSGNTAIEMELLARGRVAAAAARTDTIAPANRGKVLLVPIMQAGYTPAMLTTLKAQIEASLADYRYRIYPGGINAIWSSEVIVSSSITPTGRINISDGVAFNTAGLQFEQIRQRYNAVRNDKIGVAFGVLDPAIVAGGAGLGTLGVQAQWTSRQNCLDEFVTDVLDFFGVDRDCGPEFPQFQGWAIGDNLASRYFAHELGHMMGLIPSGSANYANFTSTSGGDNHSGTSELTKNNRPAACSETGTTFDPSRTMYQQPGIAEPVVNPVTGNQYKPQLSTNSGATDRAKSLLSYACGRTGQNTFFEPSDLNYLRAQRFGTTRPLYEPRPHPRNSVAEQTQAEPERLHVSGIITPTASTASGAIWQVEYKASTVKTSADYQSGYALVQYNAAGVPLQRWGVLPLFTGEPHNHEGGSSGRAETRADGGFFSANIPKAPGVTRIDLVQAGTTLATWRGGATPPSISLISPVGGENLTSGDLVVTWNASDADGDALNVSIEFSRDDGATWTPVASARNSGSVAVPLGQLAGSNNARVRAWVSDGLNEATATSASFSVAVQAPQAVIVAPIKDNPALESTAVALIGRAVDPQDGALTNTQLVWTSDRDGLLGTGEAVYTPLSVGVHTLTLQATNSAGISSSTSTSLEILPDYDGDGLVDSEETTLGLNVLSSNDGLSDADGDGLNYRVERGRGTNPDIADTDGDGRSDSDELVDGSDPLTIDTAQPDLLSVWPLSMTFEVDLSQDVQLPQQVLQALSRSSVPVTLSADVPWIDFSTTNTSTPAVTTVVLNPILLNNGIQSGNITVASSLGTVVVPVTVTTTNKAAFCDVNGDGIGNGGDLSAVQARLGARLGDARYDYHYDVDRNGVIETVDVQLLSGCVGTAVPQLYIYLPLVQR